MSAPSASPAPSIGGTSAAAAVARKQSIPRDGVMRTAFTIGTGARVNFRHRDTLVAAPTLSPATAAGGGTPSRSAYTSSASIVAANSRLLDRFDLASIDTGSIAIQAPTRILPDPPASLGTSASTGPSPTSSPQSKSRAGGEGKGGSSSNNNNNNSSSRGGSKDSKSKAPPVASGLPATSAGGPAKIVEGDLFQSVSTYVWPKATTSSRIPTTTSTGAARPSAPTAAASTPSASSRNGAGGAATTPPPASAMDAAAPAPRDVTVTSVVPAGSVLLWTAQPTSFTVFLVSNALDKPAAMADEGAAAAAAAAATPPVPLAATPEAPSPGTAQATRGQPSIGPTGAVQVSAIQFSSRLTASATFTTHRSWRLATGVYDAHTARILQTHLDGAQGAGNGGVASPSADDAAEAVGEEFATPMPAERAGRAPPEFSPAAETGEHGGTPSSQPATAPRTEPTRIAGDGSSGTSANPAPSAPPASSAAREQPQPTSTSTDATLGPDVPAAELWSLFGFVNGDVVVYNHALRTSLKRHNSCRLQTRAVAHAAVTALCRVPREGRAETAETLLDEAYGRNRGQAGNSSSGNTAAAAPPPPPVQQQQQQTSQGNAVTAIFGDVVVGFDNGTFVVIRLNQTGGFIDDDRAAWIGYAPINVIRPCPVQPRVLGVACGDGCVRFLSFPSSFAIRRSTDEEHNAVAAATVAQQREHGGGDPIGDAAPTEFTEREFHGQSTGLELQLALDALPPEDVGTALDPRMLAVTPELTAHGGCVSIDWVPDGSGVVVGSQDDTVAYIAVSVDGARRLAPPGMDMFTPMRGTTGAGSPSRPNTAHSMGVTSISNVSEDRGDAAATSGMQGSSGSAAAAGAGASATGPDSNNAGPPPAPQGAAGGPEDGADVVELRGIIRRKFHRAWVRRVLVVPIATEVQSSEPSSPMGGSVSHDAVNLSGLTRTTVERSHVIVAACEDGNATIWHLPSQEQLLQAGHGLRPVTAGAAVPPTGNSFIGNPSFSASPATGNSVFRSVSRPLSAITPSNRSGLTPGQGLERTPSMFMGVGGGHLASGTLPRHPCGMMPKLTRVVTSPSSRAGAETVLDDTIVAMAPLPLMIASSRYGSGLAASSSGQTTQWGTRQSSTRSLHLHHAPMFVAATAKGIVYLWGVDPPE